MRVKKLHLLMLKSYLGPFVLTFFISIFVLLMQFLWKYVDDLVGKGLEWYIIAELMLYAAATFVPLALPLSILLSSIMTFGNLAEHFELVAMKSSGISLRKIMTPLIIVSVILSVATFYFSNNILPYANLKMGVLLHDVQLQKPAINIKPGIFYSDIDGFSIKVGKKDKDGQTLYDIMIYDHSRRNGEYNLTIAEQGRMYMTKDKRYLYFTLYNGCNYFEVRKQGENNPYQFRRTYFKLQQKQFDLSSFRLRRTNEALFKDNYQMLNLKQLEYQIDTLERKLAIRKQEICNILTGRYFYYNLIKDSIKNKIPNAEDTIKDFLKFFSKELVQNIIDNAVNGCRDAKENVITFKNDFEARKKYLNRHKIEWHRKFTLAVACLILFFIGAPLGAIIKKGGLGLPLVVSIIFFLFFHVLSITGEKMVREGATSPFYGMWMATFVLLPIGIFLTAKATTDSAIFDLEIYRNFFRRLIFWKNK